MRMSDRFQKLEFGTTSDGMGGSLTAYTLIDASYYPSQVIKTSKEYISKEFSLDLVEPMVLLTNEYLNIEKDYVLVGEIIYSIKSVNTVKNRKLNSYILDEVGVFNAQK